MQEIKRAIDLLNQNNYSCVVLKNDVLYHANGIGVKPIMQWFEQDKEFFVNATVADKVIGKAAALLLVLGKANFVYGRVMSESAMRILKQHNILFDFETKVPFIINRTNTGMCPLEQAVVDIDTPDEVYIAIKNKISELMSKG